MKKFLENLIVLIATFIVMFLLVTTLLPKLGYTLIVIKSGSMEPTIKTGSALIVKKQDDYKKNDIVTFINNEGKIITHRIKTIFKTNDKETQYETKGDANNSVDMFLTRKSAVIGKVILALPYFGYLIGFLKSKIGIIILIIIPALYIIYQESVKIYKEVKSRKKTEKLEKRS